jgi:dephospho-CoA kinase
VLDRAALRTIVFHDPAARAALDGIVHPEVARLFRAQLVAARSRGDRVVVYDVPLLFEAGRTGDVDVVVLVDAPDAVRRERLITSRGLRADEADAMIASQMPAALKRARAHHVIENDGDRAALGLRVDALWNALAPLTSPG